MSLRQPNSPRPHLEPLEDRFLLSSGVLTAPFGDHPPAPPAFRDAALPGPSRPALPDRPAAGASPPVVVYPVPTSPGRAVPPALDSDGDSYASNREDDHHAEPGDSQHAEGLALVRSLAVHAEQQAGTPTRPAPPAPATPLPLPAEVRAPSADEIPVVHPPTAPAPGEVAFAGAAETEGGGMPPAPVVVALAAQESSRENEATPATDGSLPGSELTPEPGDPLAGLLPLDVRSLRRNADAFFAQLTDLVRGPLDDLPVRALAPWLLLGGAVAWEVLLLPRALRPCEAAADPLLPATEDEA